MSYAVFSIPQELADEVRRTHVSPGYGHAAQLEMARGTGPCRCCGRSGSRPASVSPNGAGCRGPTPRPADPGPRRCLG